MVGASLCVEVPLHRVGRGVRRIVSKSRHPVPEWSDTCPGLNPWGGDVFGPRHQFLTKVSPLFSVGTSAVVWLKPVWMAKLCEVRFGLMPLAIGYRPNPPRKTTFGSAW